MPMLLTSPTVGQDSAGKPITVGSRVKFRDKLYTIKAFLPGQGRNGVNAIEFVEDEVHVDELPDEISVDLVPE